MPTDTTTPPVCYEIITSRDLAKRWHLPESWIRDQTRARSRLADPIPHVRFGRYVRFEWLSPELSAWLRRRVSGRK